jgi:hypothetical protein
MHNYTHMHIPMHAYTHKCAYVWKHNTHTHMHAYIHTYIQICILHIQKLVRMITGGGISHKNRIKNVTNTSISYKALVTNVCQWYKHKKEVWLL